ncbi:hypothetical protein PIB30_071407 [Stylosanthes scabra]|uniref:Uncharacterized protein n=1 Tax=Stylosanthes scabra TaxID=79078 RepID=A0ABU6WNP7_9FABA|nr:hypothetical protein [Stylosanthes scabra]
MNLADGLKILKSDRNVISMYEAAENNGDEIEVFTEHPISVPMVAEECVPDAGVTNDSPPVMPSKGRKKFRARRTPVTSQLLARLMPIALSFNPRGIDTPLHCGILLDTIRYTCRDLGFAKSDHQVFGAVADARISQPLDLGKYTESYQGSLRDKPTIEFDPEIEKTLKKNRSRVKAQRTLQFDQEEVNSEEGASEKSFE